MAHFISCFTASQKTHPHLGNMETSRRAPSIHPTSLCCETPAGGQPAEDPHQFSPQHGVLQALIFHPERCEAAGARTLRASRREKVVEPLGQHRLHTRLPCQLRWGAADASIPSKTPHPCFAPRWKPGKVLRRTGSAQSRLTSSAAGTARPSIAGPEVLLRQLPAPARPAVFANLGVLSAPS